MNREHEFLEGVIAADQALIAALKEQRTQLRAVIESLLNCVDPNRDREEIKRACSVLKDTKL